MTPPRDRGAQAPRFRAYPYEPPDILLRDGPDGVPVVRRLMAELSWSVAELARRCGLDRSTIDRALDGDRGIGAGSIGGLLGAFHDVYDGQVRFDHLFRVGYDTEQDLFPPAEEDPPPMASSA
jgi:transcriptional regulator with XRE-family HTH domain